jgi:predicted DNA-binding transcriptional regulator AlpA
MSEIQNSDLSGRGETQSILAGLLTPKGLALELGVTERTIARWHQHRIGPPRVRIGRKVYYRKDSVIAWVGSCENSEPRAHRAGSLRVRKSFPSRVTFQGNHLPALSGSRGSEN